jgi:hypothetical protein
MISSTCWLPKTSLMAATGSASPTSPSTSAPQSTQPEQLLVQPLPRGRPAQLLRRGPGLPFGRILVDPVRLELVDRGRRHEDVEVAGSNLHALAKLLQELVTTKGLIGHHEVPTHHPHPSSGCQPEHRPAHPRLKPPSQSTRSLQAAAAGRAKLSAAPALNGAPASIQAVVALAGGTVSRGCSVGAQATMASRRGTHSYAL